MVPSWLKIHLSLIKILKKTIMKKMMKKWLHDPERLHDLYNDLQFLPERMKSEKNCGQIGQ